MREGDVKRPRQIHVDHIRPVHLGGSDDPDNLRLSMLVATEPDKRRLSNRHDRIRCRTEAAGTGRLTEEEIVIGRGGGQSSVPKARVPSRGDPSPSSPERA